MLKVDANIPLKETYSYLASFPRFSLIEKIQPKFFPTSSEASKRIAEEIRTLILQKANKTKEPFVLGLATGSTPLKLYKQLVQMYNRGEISFKNVVTFNLDQYYPISKENRESYNHYMMENLFNHIDIPRDNINIPDGEITRQKVTQYCEQYQRKIKKYGGIDLQILGIGRTGHIGFNQPPSPIKSITRLVYLHRLTRKDAANAFEGMENVPKCAITMGIETISRARKIIIMAWSQSKANIVKKSIQGQQTNEIPSTFLHNHPDATFYLDKGAGEQLSRFKVPWTIKGDKQDPIVPRSEYWISRMVHWLSLQLKKPILRLTFQDYQDKGLSPLILDIANGRVQDLNLFVYRKLHKKITGWPLGDRPEQQKGESQQYIYKKTGKCQNVLIFSPHPDDDVISMGGTIHRMKEQGHHLMIAYMVSGSNAVHDHEAKKYLHFMKDYLKFKTSKMYENKSGVKAGIEELLSEIIDAEENLDQKQELQKDDVQTVKKIKGLIRSSQAKIAIQTFGIQSKDVYCMELPFYSHHSKKKDISEDDVIVLKDLLRVTEPDVIFAAGDLTDPHGTHRKCLEIILKARNQEMEILKTNSQYKPLFPPADKIFLYRGAWEEWDLAMCRTIIPMSPSEVEDKTRSILKHQSQKDHPMFPGDDKRQFWVRSKQRNRDTAAKLRNLGFSDYEAAECFVNLDDLMNYDEF